MGKRIRATFRNGHIEPQEPVEFPEGAELVVTVDHVRKDGRIPDDVPSIWAGYDPGGVIAALRASAGALVGVDREQLIADIHAAREQADRDRP
jgi:hypothetical protein